MAKTTWGWRRWIAPAQAEAWIARLQVAGCATWTLTERPDRGRALLAVYAATRAEVEPLHGLFGGELRAVLQSTWLPTKPTPPTRIGPTLEILHAPPRGRLRPHQLVIPHGMAFGSGEHGTTFMLLRELMRGPVPRRVLDLGAGSGVLALAARRAGATTIAATDFDADAIRTARENERANFPTPLIRWRRADVKTLAAKPVYDLVLANLFSGILVEAAPRIAAVVAPGGGLWLSGILREQGDEVAAAYTARGLKFARRRRRGKWIMLRFDKPTSVP
jgi:ribosomal protein L11 methyltransferase